MPTAHVRNGALTIELSDELRAKLGVREGEELAAHVFEDSLTVTRRSPEALRRAGERILATIDRVRLRPGKQPLCEEQIVEEVHAARRADHARTRHD